MRRRFRMTPTAQVLVLFAVLWNTGTCPGQTAADPHAAPLSSWNEGPAKKAILTFVAASRPREAQTSSPQTSGSPRSITMAHSGASSRSTCRPRLHSIGQERWRSRDPSLKEKPGFQAILSNDRAAMARFGTAEIASLIAMTHAGMTPEAFEDIAKAWLATAEHPKFQRLHKECVYQPQLELLAYLRANGFKLFIVTGGGTDFVRAFSEETYDIPRERVIGSSGKTRFEVRDGKAEVIKLPEIGDIDDREGKPININLHIGRRPILAFGNSDGDLQMLEYTAGGKGARLSLLLHHDDAAREYAYDRDSRVGHLDKALDAAKQERWTVVSMKNDWRTVFPPVAPKKATP